MKRLSIVLCAVVLIRRAVDNGKYYFIANRGDKMIDGWVPLATGARSMVLLDPLSGRTGVAMSRAGTNNAISILVKFGAGAFTDVFLQLAPGESIVVRTFNDRVVKGPAWNYWNNAGDAVTLSGQWQVKFVQGGPELPAAFIAFVTLPWTRCPICPTRR